MKFHIGWIFFLLLFSNLSFSQDSDDFNSFEAPSEFSDTSSNDSPMSDDADSDIAVSSAIEEVSPRKRRSEQENLNDNSKKLSLRAVIEEGLRRNNLEKARQFSREKNELEWKDNHADFWYPQLSLSLKTDETLVDNLYTDLNANSGTSKTPNGYVGLGFENYNLFNWGRDYLNYQNNKNTYERRKQQFDEQRRRLRFNLIAQYFNLTRAKRILQIKRLQLRHTSFMHRLAKEKLTLKKVDGQHYLQTKAEFLRAHAEFQQASYDVTEQENKMANLLGDDLTTSYTPTEQLRFVPLTTKKNEAYQYALRQNPEYLDAKVKLENANRDFQRTLKENMPLPRFDLKFGAYKHHFTGAGVYDEAGLENGSRNVELVASINMSWKIFGSGGLFNSRINERSYLDKRIAEIDFTESKRNTSTKVNTFHRQISYLEKQVEANDAFVKNARKTFDRTLDNFISGKTPFAEIKIVLDSLILSETQYESAKYQHMATKLQLADLMGLDDFPGESFEKMVSQ
jgi:outer membrane protein TolC